MASIHKKKLRSGRVVWELTQGSGKDRVRFVAGQSKEEAEAALRLFKRQLTVHGNAPEGKTLRQAVDEYCKYLKLNRSPGTARRYGRVIETFCRCYMPAFHPGAELLRTVKPAHLEEYKRARLSGEVSEAESKLRADLEQEEALRAELAEKPEAEAPQDNAKYGWLGRKRLHRTVTRRTVNYELQCLSTFFRWAIRQNYLFVNPAEHVERFRVPKKSLPKFMTAKELKRFFEACSPWERRVFTIMLLSGMRKGELMNLEWEDVHLDLGVILIRAKEGWQPKTNERVIPISPSLYQVFAEEWQDRRSDQWVVANRAGKQETHLLPKLKKVCRRAGIKPAAATLHALRHSFGAHLRMAGVPLANIADLMGHADLATTQIYAKVEMEHLRESVGRLSALVPQRPSLRSVTQGGDKEGGDSKLLEAKGLEGEFPGWLGGRDSNPDSAVQSRMSCH